MSIPLFVPRITRTLLGDFGLLALVLAAVGLAGVVAFYVSLRTREIGVHLALGAERRDVLKLMVKQSVSRLAAAPYASRSLGCLYSGHQPAPGNF
jgi:ABC-type antimicrobial peptide transport system permease subunit